MIPDELKKALGRPGIWMYTKESNYEMAVKMMEEKLGTFHDKERGEIKVKYAEFQYRASIIEDDFFSETFNDEDTIIGIWMVDQKYNNFERVK